MGVGEGERVREARSRSKVRGEGWGTREVDGLTGWRLPPVQEDLDVTFNVKQKVKIPLWGGVLRTDPACVFHTLALWGCMELPWWEEPLGLAEGGVWGGLKRGLHGASTGLPLGGQGRQALSLPHTLCFALRGHSLAGSGGGEHTLHLGLKAQLCLHPLCLSHVGEGAWGTRRWPPVPMAPP